MPYQDDIRLQSTLFGFAVLALILLSRLNVAKSHFDPGSPMQGETMVITEEANGLPHVTDEEHFSDGTS